MSLHAQVLRNDKAVSYEDAPSFTNVTNDTFTAEDNFYPVLQAADVKQAR